MRYGHGPTTIDSCFLQQYPVIEGAVRHAVDCISQRRSRAKDGLIRIRKT